MTIIHFASIHQVQHLRPYMPERAWALMLAHSLPARELQRLREQQAQKKLDKIAATIFPPGLLP